MIITQNDLAYAFGTGAVPVLGVILELTGIDQAVDDDDYRFLGSAGRVVTGGDPSFVTVLSGGRVGANETAAVVPESAVETVLCH